MLYFDFYIHVSGCAIKPYIYKSLLKKCSSDRKSQPFKIKSLVLEVHLFPLGSTHVHTLAAIMFKGYLNYCIYYCIYIYYFVDKWHSKRCLCFIGWKIVKQFNSDSALFCLTTTYFALLVVRMVRYKPLKHCVYKTKLDKENSLNNL